MKSSKRSVANEASDQRTTGSATLAEPELKQERFELTWLDWLLAPLFALLAAVWTFPYVGTAINWDDLLYMNVSQYTTAQAWVLNRYGHIYLQKLFFWFAGDALTGTRLYWCFLFFSTCVLVYWCAKLLAGKRGYAIGLVAVLLFCIQPIFARYVGCTLADFAVMFVIMLGTFVYLAFLAGKHKHRRLIIAVLGLIFFGVMKSKETGICMAVLFLGLGEEPTGARSIGRFAKDIGWLCLGIIAGSVLLMALDMVFIGDAFFSVRPSSFRELFAFNFKEPVYLMPIMTWHTYLSLQPLLAPWLLYLLIGWKMNQTSSSRDRMIVWLVPLVLLFFIKFILMLRGYWHADSRYLAPVVPGICIWASQFFHFKMNWSLFRGKSHTGILKSLVVLVPVLLAFVIVLAFMSKAADIAQGTRLKTSEQLYANAIMPLSTTMLLIVAVASRKRALTALFLSSLCLFFIIYFPFSNNLTSLKQRVVAKKSEWRYEPYRVFTNELRFDKDVKILVSKDVHKRSWMLGRDVRSHCWMFNVFFNQKFDYDRFIDGSWEDVLKGNYTYAFLTWRDWRGICEKHNVEHLIKNYAVKADKRTQIILLKKH